MSTTPVVPLPIVLGLKNEYGSIKIYDTLGQIIFLEKNIKEDTGLQINMNNFETGVYVLVLEVNGKVYARENIVCTR